MLQSHSIAALMMCLILLLRDWSSSVLRAMPCLTLYNPDYYLDSSSAAVPHLRVHDLEASQCFIT